MAIDEVIRPVAGFEGFRDVGDTETTHGAVSLIEVGPRRRLDRSQPSADEIPRRRQKSSGTQSLLRPRTCGCPGGAGRNDPQASRRSVPTRGTASRSEPEVVRIGRRRSAPLARVGGPNTPLADRRGRRLASACSRGWRRRTRRLSRELPDGWACNEDADGSRPVQARERQATRRSVSVSWPTTSAMTDAIRAADHGSST